MAQSARIAHAFITEPPPLADPPLAAATTSGRRKSLRFADDVLPARQSSNPATYGGGGGLSNAQSSSFVGQSSSSSNSSAAPAVAGGAAAVTSSSSSPPPAASSAVGAPTRAAMRMRDAVRKMILTSAVMDKFDDNLNVETIPLPRVVVPGDARVQTGLTAAPATVATSPERHLESARELALAAKRRDEMQQKQRAKARRQQEQDRRKADLSVADAKREEEEQRQRQRRDEECRKSVPSIVHAFSAGAGGGLLNASTGNASINNSSSLNLSGREGQANLNAQQQARAQQQKPAPSFLEFFGADINEQNKQPHRGASIGSIRNVPDLALDPPTLNCDVPLRRMVELVLENQSVQTKHALSELVRLFLISERPIKIYTISFWIALLLVRRQPERSLELQLHHYLALEYGKMFSDLVWAERHDSIHDDKRDTVLRLFPSVTSQVVFYAMTTVFPNNKNKIGTVSFRKKILRTFTYWMTGVDLQCTAECTSWLEHIEVRRRSAADSNSIVRNALSIGGTDHTEAAAAAAAKFSSRPQRDSLPTSSSFKEASGRDSSPAAARLQSLQRPTALSSSRIVTSPPQRSSSTRELMPHSPTQKQQKQQQHNDDAPFSLTPPPAVFLVPASPSTQIERASSMRRSSCSNSASTGKSGETPQQQQPQSPRQQQQLPRQQQQQQQQSSTALSPAAPASVPPRRGTAVFSEHAASSNDQPLLSSPSRSFHFRQQRLLITEPPVEHGFHLSRRMFPSRFAEMIENEVKEQQRQLAARMDKKRSFLDSDAIIFDEYAPQANRAYSQWFEQRFARGRLSIDRVTEFAKAPPMPITFPLLDAIERTEEELREQQYNIAIQNSNFNDLTNCHKSQKLAPQLSREEAIDQQRKKQKQLEQRRKSMAAIADEVDEQRAQARTQAESKELSQQAAHLFGGRRSDSSSSGIVGGPFGVGSVVVVGSLLHPQAPSILPQELKDIFEGSGQNLMMSEKDHHNSNNNGGSGSPSGSMMSSSKRRQIRSPSTSFGQYQQHHHHQQQQAPATTSYEEIERNSRSPRKHSIAPAPDLMAAMHRAYDSRKHKDSHNRMLMMSPTQQQRRRKEALDLEGAREMRANATGFLPQHSPLMLYYLKVVLEQGDALSAGGTSHRLDASGTRRAIKMSRMSMLDRRSHGAKFSLEARGIVRHAEQLMAASAQDTRMVVESEIARRNRALNVREQWARRLHLANKLLKDADSPTHNPELRIAIDAALTAMEWSLDEKGKQIQQIVAGHLTALKALEEVVFRVPRKIRTILWDQGGRVYKRLLYWARTGPEPVAVVTQDDAVVEEKLDDMITEVRERVRLDEEERARRRAEDELLYQRSHLQAASKETTTSLSEQQREMAIKTRVLRRRREFARKREEFFTTLDLFHREALGPDRVALKRTTSTSAVADASAEVTDPADQAFLQTIAFLNQQLKDQRLAHTVSPGRRKLPMSAFRVSLEEAMLRRELGDATGQVLDPTASASSTAKQQQQQKASSSAAGGIGNAEHTTTTSTAASAQGMRRSAAFQNSAEYERERKRREKMEEKRAFLQYVRHQQEHVTFKETRRRRKNPIAEAKKRRKMKSISNNIINNMSSGAHGAAQQSNGDGGSATSSDEAEEQDDDEEEEEQDQETKRKPKSKYATHLVFSLDDVRGHDDEAIRGRDGQRKLKEDEIDRLWEAEQQRIAAGASTMQLNNGDPASSLSFAAASSRRRKPPPEFVQEKDSSDETELESGFDDDSDDEHFQEKIQGIPYTQRELFLSRRQQHRDERAAEEMLADVIFSAIRPPAHPAQESKFAASSTSEAAAATAYGRSGAGGRHGGVRETSSFALNEQQQQRQCQGSGPTLPPLAALPESTSFVSRVGGPGSGAADGAASSHDEAVFFTSVRPTAAAAAASFSSAPPKLPAFTLRAPGSALSPRGSPVSLPLLISPSSPSNNSSSNNNNNIGTGSISHRQGSNNKPAASGSASAGHHHVGHLTSALHKEMRNYLKKEEQRPLKPPSGFSGLAGVSASLRRDHHHHHPQNPHQLHPSFSQHGMSPSPSSLSAAHHGMGASMSTHPLGPGMLTAHFGQSAMHAGSSHDSDMTGAGGNGSSDMQLLHARRTMNPVGVTMFRSSSGLSSMPHWRSAVGDEPSSSPTAQSQQQHQQQQQRQSLERNATLSAERDNVTNNPYW